MTREEKDLLLRDLCTRLPYNVKCYIEFDDGKVFPERTLMPIMIQDFKNHEFVIYKPYLRPMSSMTEEEVDEFTQFDVYADGEYVMSNYETIDWLNAHHFDYRGLIGKGLALEAPKGMYNI